MDTVDTSRDIPTVSNPRFGYTVHISSYNHCIRTYPAIFTWFPLCSHPAHTTPSETLKNFENLYDFYSFLHVLPLVSKKQGNLNTHVWINSTHLDIHALYPNQQMDTMNISRHVYTIAKTKVWLHLIYVEMKPLYPTKRCKMQTKYCIQSISIFTKKYQLFQFQFYGYNDYISTCIQCIQAETWIL